MTHLAASRLTWRYLIPVCLLVLFFAWSASSQAASHCAAHILSISAAPAADLDQPRPDSHWETITLPDDWSERWPEHKGPVWYNIEWESTCPDTLNESPLGLGVGGISMAGEIYLNDTLIWRDRSLKEPLSLNWGLPRWWLLPASALHEGVNSIWIKVAGHLDFSPGLGPVTLGPADEIEALYAQKTWLQRTSFFISMILSAAVGCIFFIVWCMHRSERAYGWYALMTLFWVLYLQNVLAVSAWPFSELLMHSRANTILFALYVLCFCLFTWRFGEQQLPRTSRLLLSGTALAGLLSLLGPRWLLDVIWKCYVLIFLVNCLQFQWHAWRTRKPEHLLLALCWLLFLVVAVHDSIMILKGWRGADFWGPISTPIATVFMALLLGVRLASSLRRVENFNHELQQHVAEARTELSHVLAQQHEQALDHAKLQERLSIVHDLHDGLGGSLVRSMALLEQTPKHLSNQEMLSLLKTLRDDLRQVIDHGSSSAATVPATPKQWAAPIRHRFTHLFDEMGVESNWQFDEVWQDQPSPLQCLGLTRLIEEVLSNIIKHSRAKHVRICCSQPQADVLQLEISDDGVGFDLAAVQHAGLSVGMRSMAARAERMGAKLHIVSSPEGTSVSVRVPLAASH